MMFCDAFPLTSGCSWRSVTPPDGGENSLIERGVNVSQPMKHSYQDNSPLVIGQGMIVKGTIHSGADVFVYGEVEGELELENSTLTVGPHGKVIASAKAHDMDIQGIITGDVETTGTTSIRECGQLFGDVRTGGIVIESGAVLKGTIEIVTRPRPNGEAGDGK